MPIGFWGLVVAAFSIFTSLGLALFFIDDALPADWRPLFVPLRTGLVVLGAIGAASALAHSRGWPGARHMVRVSVVVGAVACVAYLVAFFYYSLSAPAEFRNGGIRTLLGSVVVGLGSLAVIGEGVRRVWRKTGATPAP